MSKARCAQLVDYGDVDNFRVVDQPVPQPGVGQVRIVVAAAAVNPVDQKARLGYLKDYVPLVFPARLGADVSGTVEAVGPDVKNFQVGDRVAGMVNPFADGAYGSHVLAYAAGLAHVPVGIDLVEAAAAPTGVLTGTQLVERGLSVRKGERVLVTGAGGSTGRAAVWAAAELGATVFAGLRSGSEAAVADLPIHGILDLADDAQLDAVGPLDSIADTVGGPAVSRLYPWLKANGTLASIAVPPPDAPPLPTQHFTALTVEWDRACLERFFADVARGDKQILIADRLPLVKVAEAHSRLAAGGVKGKLLLIP